MGKVPPATDGELDDLLGVLPPPDDAHEILGDMMQRSPALQEMIKKRMAGRRPMVAEGDSLPVPPTTTKPEKPITEAKLQEIAARVPAYSEYAKRRAPQPVRFTSARPTRARTWQLAIGPAYGQAGTVTTLMAQPQCLFRGEKIVANDSGTPPGTGTLIQQIIVGNKLQMPNTGKGILTQFLGPQSLHNGLKMDTCTPPLTIAMTVSFMQPCTFDCLIFGQAVV